jgi:hypothetical protein
MTLPHRRRKSSSWPLLAATTLAVAAGLVAWSLFFREAKELSEDELREMEAFEEYERKKRSSST